MDDFWDADGLVVAEMPAVPGPMVADALLDTRNACEVPEMVRVIDELLVRVSARGMVTPDEAKVIAFQLGAAERQYVPTRPGNVGLRSRFRAAVH